LLKAFNVNHETIKQQLEKNLKEGNRLELQPVQKEALVPFVVSLRAFLSDFCSAAQQRGPDQTFSFVLLLHALGKLVSGVFHKFIGNCFQFEQPTK